MWERLYKPGSSKEGGTLMQLRNLINRRNVGEGKKITSHVNQIEDFLELVITCHLVAAAMHFFSMYSVSDEPHSNGFPSNIAEMELYRRKNIFFSKLGKIIDEYVVPRDFSVEKVKPATTQSTTGNPHLARIYLEHQYCSVPVQCQQRSLPVSVTSAAARSQASQVVKKAAPDGIFNYASAVLNDGLLLFELKDAIREGDGNRILRCWKMMFLYYRSAGHVNYQKEAFQLLASIHATASPKIASQMKWGRVVNLRGGLGHNIPADLHMEHLNRTVKDYVANVGANVDESSIVQCGKSLNGIMNVCDAFDSVSGVSPMIQAHSGPNVATDEKKIIKELTESSSVFDYIPGRVHKTFPSIQPNVVPNMDKKALVNYIKEQQKALLKQQTFARVYGHFL